MLYVYAPLPAIFIYSIYIRRFGKYSSVPNITAKVAPSPHEVRLTPLDTNPVFQCLRLPLPLVETLLITFTSGRNFTKNWFRHQYFGTMVCSLLVVFTMS